MLDDDGAAFEFLVVEGGDSIIGDLFVLDSDKAVAGRACAAHLDAARFTVRIQRVENVKNGR